MSGGKKFVYGPGIYSAPDIKVALISVEIVKVNGKPALLICTIVRKSCQPKNLKNKIIKTLNGEEEY